MYLLKKSFYGRTVEGGVNYLFFEKGFHKLSLREAGIKLESCNKNKIYCANTSDYMPIIDSYGYCFEYKAKIGKVESYFESDDYLEKKRVFDISLNKIRNEDDTE